MIDVTVERALLLIRIDQNRIDTDHPATFADHFDLVVADVALHVVKLSRVRVRNDQRLARKIDNLFETRRIDVGKIDNDAEALAFADEIAAKWRQSFRRGAARGKNSTVTGGVCPRMS